MQNRRALCDKICGHHASTQRNDGTARLYFDRNFINEGLTAAPEHHLSTQLHASPIAKITIDLPQPRQAATSPHAFAFEPSHKELLLRKIDDISSSGRYSVGIAELEQSMDAGRWLTGEAFDPLVPK